MARLDVALYHDQPPSGGAFRVLAEYVARAGHRFTLYTPRPAGEPTLVELRDVEVVRQPVEVPPGELRTMAHLAARPALGRRIARRIDAAGHDVVFCHTSALVGAPEVLPALRTPSLYYAPEQMRAVYDATPEWQRDDSLRGRLARRGLGPTTALRKWLDRRDIRAADRVVTHSHFTARRLREVYGVRAAVVHLGVDASPFAAAGRRPDGSVLSVGAVHPLKGHHFVLEALGRLPAPRPRLVVVGDRGDYAGPLRDLADRLHVPLTLHQAIPYAQVVECFARASVVACGQYEEPFGLVALEAMAAGAPVVAVREGGFAETVTHDVTGLLVPRDREAFGATLAAVLRDRALAARLSSAGRTDAVDRWTWDRTAAGFDELLVDVARRLR